MRVLGDGGVVDLGDGDNPSHPPTEMVMAQPNCEAAKQNHLSGKFKCENFQHQYMATLHYSTLHYITLHCTTQHYIVIDYIEQAGAELGQAQLQLELGFTLIKVCCISLMVTN